jgi:hypothetical protein
VESRLVICSAKIALRTQIYKYSGPLGFVNTEVNYHLDCQKNKKGREAPFFNPY